MKKTLIISVTFMIILTILLISSISSLCTGSHINYLNNRYVITNEKKSMMAIASEYNIEHDSLYSFYIKYTLLLFNNTLVNGPYSGNGNNTIDPAGISYDYADHTVFVAEMGNNTVSVVSSITNKVIAYIYVQSEPMGIAYDQANGLVYVTNYKTDNVTVINGTTYNIVQVIPVGKNPDNLVYDPYNGYIYVADYYGNNVTVIDGTTNSVKATVYVGANPYGLAYDSSNYKIFVTNYGSNSVTVINGTSVVYTIPNITSPYGAVYDPANEFLYVASSSSNISVINVATYSIYTIIPVGNGPFQVIYDPLNQYIFVSNSMSNNITIINGTSNIAEYTVYVGHTPSGLSFNPYNGYVYVSNTGTGTLSIIAGTIYTPVQTYTVTFKENGLPNGTYWYVVLNNSENTSVSSNITFSEPNGTYHYTISAVYGYITKPGSGNITVTGSNVSVSILFQSYSQQYFNISFVENGLPKNSTWHVTLNSSMQSTTSDIINFTELNGTYFYQVNSENGYYGNPSYGYVGVNGSNIIINITFIRIIPEQYKITFVESGLPAGTNWSVTLNGTTETSFNNTVTFSVTNGTYSYNVSRIYGYVINPSQNASGTIIINGKDVNVQISFVSNNVYIEKANASYLLEIVAIASGIIIIFVFIYLFVWQKGLFDKIRKRKGSVSKKEEDKQVSTSLPQSLNKIDNIKQDEMAKEKADNTGFPPLLRLSKKKP